MNWFLITITTCRAHRKFTSLDKYHLKIYTLNGFGVRSTSNFSIILHQSFSLFLLRQCCRNISYLALFDGNGLLVVSIALLAESDFMLADNKVVHHRCNTHHLIVDIYIGLEWRTHNVDCAHNRRRGIELIALLCWLGRNIFRERRCAVTLFACLEDICARREHTAPWRLALESIVDIDIATRIGSNSHRSKIGSERGAIAQLLAVANGDTILVGNVHILHNTNMVRTARELRTADRGLADKGVIDKDVCILERARGIDAQPTKGGLKLHSLIDLCATNSELAPLVVVVLGRHLIVIRSVVERNHSTAVGVEDIALMVDNQNSITGHNLENDILRT